MFNPFKKGDDAPPDVGHEEDYEAKKQGKDVSEDSAEDEALEEVPESKGGEKSGVKSLPVQGGGELVNVEFEKIHARIEAISSWLKQFQERFSDIGERLGEIRSMNLENEKKIMEATKEGARVIELFKEIKPEELGSNYRKLEMKITTLSEKIDSNKQFVDNVLDEFKELRNRADIFIGTEGLLKLNEDVKRDLIELQKLGSKVRLHADKSEQIFVELKKGLAENKKLSAMLSQVDSMFPEFRKELEKVKIDISNISSVKKDMENLENSVETVLSIAKSNKEDIGNLAVTVGDTNIKRVSDYEYKMASILQIIDTLAGQISQIKRKVGIETKTAKINVTPSKKEIIAEGDINMSHMRIHPQIARSLVTRTAQSPGLGVQASGQSPNTGGLQETIQTRGDEEGRNPGEDILRLVEEGNKAFNAKDAEKAKRIYQDCWQRYNSLGYEDDNIYHVLLDFYNRLESVR